MGKRSALVTFAVLALCSIVIGAAVMSRLSCQRLGAVTFAFSSSWGGRDENSATANRCRMISTASFRDKVIRKCLDEYGYSSPDLVTSAVKKANASVKKRDNGRFACEVLIPDVSRMSGTAIAETWLALARAAVGDENAALERKVLGRLEAEVGIRQKELHDAQDAVKTADCERLVCARENLARVKGRWENATNSYVRALGELRLQHENIVVEVPVRFIEYTH